MQLTDYFNWDEETIQSFQSDLFRWYDQEKRTLPWRTHRTPYYTWVSEIMLQQTQVQTVIPYFERFIQTFPDVESLSNADDEELLHVWQGLGYYSRARNMKIAADQIMTNFDGKIPNNYDDLMTLRGIGPYTAAAIASMAFNQPEPALDGNLMRITARLFNIHEDITKVKTQRLMRAILSELIDEERPGDFNQALMDLGAQIMTASNPYPKNHPLEDYDLSFQLGTSHELPVKKRTVKPTEHDWLAYYIQNDQGEILLRQHQSGELLKGLWHFPLFELEDVHETLEFDDLVGGLSSFVVLPNDESLSLELLTDSVKHLFSHRHWTVQIVTGHLNHDEVLDDDLKWVPLNELKDYPMSTLQTKLLNVLFEPEEL